MNMLNRSKQRDGFSPHDPASRRQLRLSSTLLACLLLFGLCAMPGAARATCWFTSGSATTVTFNAGTITLTPSTQLNSILWTSSTASPANSPQLNCDGNTNGGIVNTIAGPPTGSDNTLFPTGIPGVSYRLLHPDASTKLAAYPSNTVGSGNATYSVASNLQLVYTGPFLPPNNSTLTGQLSQWKIDICNNPNLFFGYYIGCNGTVSPQPVETFNINAIINILVPTCNIDPNSVNKTVTLPNVPITQFTGPASTSSNTPFSLHLINCPSNRSVFITLDSSSPQPGAPGVIAPSGAGYAAGVGVQILQANGTTPVTFGTTFQTGTISGSTYDINLNARYYQTGTTISGGLVKAVATYTLNYQ